MTCARPARRLEVLLVACFLLPLLIVGNGCRSERANDGQIVLAQHAPAPMRVGRLKMVRESLEKDVNIKPACIDRPVRIDDLQSRAAKAPNSGGEHRQSTTTSVVVRGAIAVKDDNTHGEIVELAANVNDDTVVLFVVKQDHSIAEAQIRPAAVLQERFEWVYYPVMARFESNDAGTTSTNWLLWRERRGDNAQPKIYIWMVLLPPESNDSLGSVFTRRHNSQVAMADLTRAWQYVVFPADASSDPKYGQLTTAYSSNDSDPSCQRLFRETVRAIRKAKLTGALLPAYSDGPPAPDP